METATIPAPPHDLGAATTQHPFTDDAAFEAFEDVLRDWMKMWRDQGRVLEPDSLLWKYWPIADNGQPA